MLSGLRHSAAASPLRYRHTEGGRRSKCVIYWLDVAANVAAALLMYW